MHDSAIRRRRERGTGSANGSMVLPAPFLLHRRPSPRCSAATPPSQEDPAVAGAQEGAEALARRTGEAEADGVLARRIAQGVARQGLRLEYGVKTTPSQPGGPIAMAVRMLRKNRIQYLAKQIGGDFARVLDARDGWPGLMEIKSTSGEWRPFEVHVGTIGPSTGRGRSQAESRFQNPGSKKPMSSPSGAPALLLGMWEGAGDRTVLVCMETEHRLGRATRQSLFFPLHLLERAASVGWDEHFSSTGEQIVGLLPDLLPTYIEMKVAGVMVGLHQIASILDAAGLQAEAEEETPVERARRASSQLVRSSTFSKRVIEAYDGLCAM